MRLILLVLLSGCAQLAPTIHEPALPSRFHARVEVLNEHIPGCKEAFELSVRSLKSEGKTVQSSKNAHYKLACYPDIAWYYRLIFPARIRGMSSGRVAWVYVRDDLNVDANYMKHELEHLLFGGEHGLEMLPVFIDILG